MASPFLAPIEAAIVDLDGTLVDTLGDFHAALGEMLRELALSPLSREEVALFIGKGSEHLIRQALAHAGGAPSLYEHAWDRYQAAYRRLNGRWSTVYPGVEEGLAQLRARGLRLACLTNKPGEFARELLEAKGLAGAFEHVFGGDAFARKKPDPLPLFGTCEALRTAPARTLVVGDSRNDAEAARAAGCPLVLVTYGYNHGEPVRAVPAAGHLDSLAQIGAWLQARAG